MTSKQRETTSSPKKLANWNTFQKLLAAGKTAKIFGFSCKDGDVSRFGARWRLAANLSGITLNGFSAKTQRGYAGILKLVLAINAAEQYALMLGVRPSALPKRLGACLVKPKAPAAAKALLEMLDEHLESRIKVQISKMAKEGQYDALVIGQGIRHLFAHGILTPGANDANPEAVGAWCEQMADAVLDALDRDFSKTISSCR